MKTCDICGVKIEKASDLNPLSDMYRTDDVQEVCNGCLNELNEHIRSVNDVLDKIQFKKKLTFWQKFIARMKHEKVRT